MPSWSELQDKAAEWYNSLTLLDDTLELSADTYGDIKELTVEVEAGSPFPDIIQLGMVSGYNSDTLLATDDFIYAPNKIDNYLSEITSTMDAFNSSPIGNERTEHSNIDVKTIKEDNTTHYEVTFDLTDTFENYITDTPVTGQFELVPWSNQIFMTALVELLNENAEGINPEYIVQQRQF